MDFDESEVMFSEYSSSYQSLETKNDDKKWKYYNSQSSSHGPNMMIMNLSYGLKMKKKKPIMIGSSSSVPVNIPRNEMSCFRYDDDDDDGDGDGDGDGDDDDDVMRRLPPHLIIERRVNEEVARSFSPLKGKYLCDVRNSILRLTGFLEG